MWLLHLPFLCIDMNSFFASVEQHEEPYLRGKPVGITAMEGDVGCLVAASYEAKYFGVKTTMSIKEARALCPKIILRPSRHRLYVNYNQRIARIFDQYAELEYVRSVDEFQSLIVKEVLPQAIPIPSAMQMRLQNRHSGFILNVKVFSLLF